MKSFLTYALMVGVPGAGVLGILHAGQGLQAPHSVGGEWRVTAAGRPGPVMMSIEQSGPGLGVVAPGLVDARLAATIRSDTVEAALAGCARFRATVDRRARPETMSGVLAAADCRPVAFRATRVAGQAGEGIH